MDVVTIDFETYYDADYSLSKMTTEEYVRDKRFEIVGVAVKVNDDDTIWYSGEKPGRFIQSLDYANRAILAHNTLFDGAILSWHMGVKPKLWLDTLSMARAIVGPRSRHSLAALAEHYGLGVKGNEVIAAKGKHRGDFTPEELAAYANYCANDVDLTYKLFKQMVKDFPTSELKLIDMTLRMYTEPKFRLAGDMLEAHLLGLRDRRKELLQGLNLGDEEEARKYLMSNAKFADLLRSHGVEPPMKISPTTGKPAYAFAKTDQGLLRLQEHPNSKVATLVSARLGTKSTIEETRTERFIGIAKRGSLPVALSYYGAHTGRFSGCLVGDTRVIVKEFDGTVLDKPIVDVLLDDLVWDGDEFVPHEGVQFSGFAEVIEWDGVKGTPDHVVFTDAGEISLREAKEGGHYITAAPYIADD